MSVLKSLAIHTDPSSRLFIVVLLKYKDVVYLDGRGKFNFIPFRNWISLLTRHDDMFNTTKAKKRGGGG